MYFGKTRRVCVCVGGWVLSGHNFRTLQLRWKKLLSQIFDWVCLGKFWAQRGALALKSLLTLNRGTITSNFDSNEPHLKFINHPFHKILICPQGVTYNPCPRALGGLINPGYIVMFFRLFWTKWQSHYFNQMCLVKTGVVKGGTSCRPSLFTLKR